MLEANGQYSPFKNEKQRSAYLAAYDRTLAELWPLPYETKEITTRFGNTHVIISGPEDGKPVILLHGYAPSSTSWYTMVGDLAKAGYRTYCPDRPGDSGKSTYTREPQNRQELADWLLDVLDVLELQNPPMIGLSYGGFMNMNFSCFYPQRIGQIICLAPGYVLRRITLWFHLRAAFSLLLGFRPLVTNFIKYLSGGIDHSNNAYLEQLRQGWKIGSSPVYMPPVFGDEELKAIRQPTLVVIGDKEVIYNPQAALQRAQKLIPDVQVELLAGAGHQLPMDQPEQLNKRILRFLADTSGG